MKKVFLIFSSMGVSLLLPLILIIVMITTVLTVTNNSSNSSKSGINQSAMKYLPQVKKYCDQYGILQYSMLVLCVMMVESNGGAYPGAELDPLQCSESGYNTKYLPRVPGAIKDPDYSIMVGVQTLAENIKLSNVSSITDMPNISIACQGYNFGSGYIYWVQKNHSGYSKANAIEFSDMMKAQLKTEVYGDPDYVEKLMRYYLPLVNGNSNGDIIIDDDGTGFAWPIPGFGADCITQHYGGEHRGIDIGVAEGTPIIAVSDGRVISSEYHYSWGNNVYVYHNDTYSTRSAHMVNFIVQPGQLVKRGQVIGYVGNTGNSFGNHLHFEVYQNGERVDPFPFIQGNMPK